MDIQPSYYAIIPATVRYNKNLKANEKLLYGEITALASSKGYCFASNSYFAELYGVSKVSVSNWVSNLEKQGYIKTQLKYAENSKQIEARYIYINDIPIKENFNTLQKNVEEGHKENFNTPIKENFKDNTTSINNTRVITTSRSSDENKSEADKDLEKISDFYQNNIGILAPNTQEHLLDSYKTFGYEMIIHALTLTVDKQATYGYTRSILQRWLKNNIKTMDDVKAEEVAFKNKQNSFVNKRGSNHKEIIPIWMKEKEPGTQQIEESPNKTAKEYNDAEMRARLNELLGE